jgi:CheY-like chemotaxis protein
VARPLLLSKGMCARDAVGMTEPTCLSGPQNDDSSPGPRMTTPDRADRVVLVVDDDDTVRQALADLLSEEGYHVVTACNGAEALDHLRQTSRARPGLILLDLMMPVMNGQEFYDQKQLDPELMAIPVVIMSAERNLWERAVSFGGAYLAKPARLETILAMVVLHWAAHPIVVGASVS